ncbi:MAG: C39 family peptidase [Bryobacterales bacterium]|nr:C39 family peptidase [Bryobacterales bacterium]
MKHAATACGWAIALLLTAAASAASVNPLELPFHRQQKNGCGAASVAMLIHYWHAQPSHPEEASPTAEEVYTALYQPELNGIPLTDMKRYLEDHGMRAFTMRGNWADVEQHLAKGRPLVVGMKSGENKPIHFVVLTGVDSNAVWLNDPTRKKPQRLARVKFEKRWALADQWMLLAVPPLR